MTRPMGCSARSLPPVNKNGEGINSISPSMFGVRSRRQPVRADLGLVIPVAMRQVWTKVQRAGRLHSTLSQHSLAPGWTRAVGTSSASMSYLELELAEKEGAAGAAPPR